MRRWSVNLLEASAAGCQRFWQIINENINAVKCSRIEKESAVSNKKATNA